MRIQRLRELSAEQTNRMLCRAEQAREDVYSRAREIMEDVRANGDDALIRLARQFDRATLTDLTTSDEEFEAAYRDADDATVEALRRAMENLERFHRAQCRPDTMISVGEGIRVGRVSRPIESVGIYVPGGRYPYPSSVLMNGVPAGLAGCPQRIICTPPSPEGTIAAPILVAADLVGIRRVYKIGGAQAVAGMAYGTETVPKVDKIFGAGNPYVTAAKMLAFGEVAIDMPAGPTEILIIADRTADPRFVAADMLAQAEHGETSPCILVTTSKSLAEAVSTEIDRQLIGLPTRDTARAALESHGALLLADELQGCIDFANLYAPEHLVVMTAECASVLDHISHAGSVFLGPFSPVSAGDYATGGNHVLPTGRYARMFSALSVDDFMRQMQVQELTDEGLAGIKDTVMLMADAEGLVAHKRAVNVRFTEVHDADRGDR